jgi:hypothetical protein
MTSHTINQQPAGVKLACPICAALRELRMGACATHTVHWPWHAAGHASPHEAAYAHLVALDEALGARQPDPLALVGSACVARLRDRLRPAIEALALGADRTRIDLLTALGMRALRGAA